MECSPGHVACGETNCGAVTGWRIRVPGVRAGACCWAIQSSKGDELKKTLNLQESFLFQLLSCPRSSLCQRWGNHCPSSYPRGRAEGVVLAATQGLLCPPAG